jgi:catechol 2,3-dioxygenase-like lactoylglutathione lyase family enzyme
MMKPKAIDHVGLKVTDMDRSLSFYCDGLGLKLLRRSDKSPGIASAVLAVGAQEMNLFSSPAFNTGSADGNPPGLDHFCLEIESASIDGLMAALAQAGIAVAKPPVKRSDGISLFVSDPDDCRVELIVKSQRSLA